MTKMRTTTSSDLRTGYVVVGPNWLSQFPLTLDQAISIRNTDPFQLRIHWWQAYHAD